VYRQLRALSSPSLALSEFAAGVVGGHRQTQESARDTPLKHASRARNAWRASRDPIKPVAAREVHEARCRSDQREAHGSDAAPWGELR